MQGVCHTSFPTKKSLRSEAESCIETMGTTCFKLHLLTSKDQGYSLQHMPQLQNASQHQKRFLKIFCSPDILLRKQERDIHISGLFTTISSSVIYAKE